MVEHTDPLPATMWFDPARVKPLPGTIADKWLQQGWREGILEGIELVLDIKFGSDGLRLWPEIRQDVLRTVLRALKAAHTPEDIRRVYQGCATWSLVAHRESPDERG
jgi:hypothetical protein